MPDAKKNQKPASLLPQLQDAKVFHHWKITERPQQKKTLWWYATAIALVGFVVYYGIRTNNFLLALLAIMISAVYILLLQHGELPLEVNITNIGIWRGPYYYGYDEFAKFWVIYKPPLVKALYLDFKSIWKPRLSIYLGNENPVQVRASLLQYIAEDLDKEAESVSDMVERNFKI